MTRWARSGSTQKHKKMPGDATPWEELSNQMKTQQNVGHSFKEKKKQKSFIKKCKNARFENDKQMSLFRKEIQDEFTHVVQNSCVKDLEEVDNETTFMSSKRTHESNQSMHKHLPKMKEMLKNEHDVKFFPDPPQHSESDVIERNNDRKIHNLKTVDAVAFASKKQFKKAKREKKFKNMNIQKNLMNQSMEKNDSNCGDVESEKIGNSNEPYRNFPTKKSEFIKFNPSHKEFGSDEKRSQDAGNKDNIHNVKIYGTTMLSKRELKKAKRKKKLMNMRDQKLLSSQSVKENDSENEKEKNYSEDEKDMNQDDCDVFGTKGNRQTKATDGKRFPLKRNLKKLKKNLRDLDRSSSQNAEESSDCEDFCTDEANVKNVPEKRFTKMKESFMEKLQRKRAKNGIILLPAKIERKLYNIKKALRSKGIPPGVLKEIIRKERRKEELKFRKVSTSKICFNCRKPGHLFAECPVKLGESNQETGMCFKCGSTEHLSYKCPKNISGYPLAKCFICTQQGHITKDCPRNKHGIYPKGGKCSICGNVNHLKKDCPSLSKKEDENTITLHTIKEWTSIDAEIVQDLKVPAKPKKPKVVKF